MKYLQAVAPIFEKFGVPLLITLVIGVAVGIGAFQVGLISSPVQRSSEAVNNTDLQNEGVLERLKQFGTQIVTSNNDSDRSSESISSRINVLSCGDNCRLRAADCPIGTNCSWGSQKCEMDGYRPSGEMCPESKQCWDLCYIRSDGTDSCPEPMKCMIQIMDPDYPARSRQYRCVRVMPVPSGNPPLTWSCPEEFLPTPTIRPTMRPQIAQCGSDGRVCTRTARCQAGTIDSRFPGCEQGESCCIPQSTLLPTQSPVCSGNYICVNQCPIEHQELDPSGAPIICGGFIVPGKCCHLRYLSPSGTPVPTATPLPSATPTLVPSTTSTPVVYSCRFPCSAYNGNDEACVKSQANGSGCAWCGKFNTCIISDLQQCN